MWLILASQGTALSLACVCYVSGRWDQQNWEPDSVMSTNSFSKINNNSNIPQNLNSVI